VAARSATLLLLALLAMLFADKRALETNLKVGLLQIREKELNFYTQNCLAVCTQAALLAGFAYSGLTQVSIPEEANFWVRLLYISVTVMAMCFEIIAVLNTTLLAIVGPGLALRGPDGSMHPAVDGMMAEYKHALSCFKLGLVCFHLSAGLFGWLMFGCAPPPAAPAAPPAAAARAAPHRPATPPPRRGRRALHVAGCARVALLFAAVRDARVPALPSADGRGGHRPLRGQRGARRLEGRRPQRAAVPQRHDLAAEQPQRRRRPVVGRRLVVARRVAAGNADADVEQLVPDGQARPRTRARHRRRRRRAVM